MSELLKLSNVRAGYGQSIVLDDVSLNIMGRTICALGDAAAMPVRAMIKHFRPEFEAKIQAARKASA